MTNSRRMVHHKTGGRGGEQSVEANNFACGWFLVISESLLNMDELFLEKKFLRLYISGRLRAGSQTEQQKTDGETACSVYLRVAAEAHSRVFVEDAF